MARAREGPRKLNDLNLYSSSLHLANFIQILFRRRVNRGILTVALVLLEITFSILGILDRIVGFLMILGIAVPPIAGVLIVDYFLLRRDRKALAETRYTVSLPRSCESLNPVALFAWLSGFLAGRFMHNGVTSVNSVLVSGGIYFCLMKLIAIVEGKSVLKDAPIFVLDEPTSSVDLQSEAVILEAVERLVRDRTTFIIAHRPGILASCTLTFQVENGRLFCVAPAPTFAMGS